jgi:hypothetical protein
VICGGLRKEGNSSEIYLIDLTKQETIEVKVPGMPAISKHSFLWRNDCFCMFGGSILKEDGSPLPNSQIFLLDLVKLNFSVVETEFENPGFYSHYVDFLFGRLFVAGGPVPSSGKRISWLFDFLHNMWVPLDFGFDISPACIFTSKKWTRFKDLHILDDKFSRILRYPLFTETQMSDVTNHPQFIHFLNKNLRFAVDFFNTLPSPNFVSLQQQTDSFIDARDQIHARLTRSGLFSDEDIRPTLSILNDCETARDTLLFTEKVSRLMDTIRTAKPPKKSVIPPTRIIPVAQLSVHQIVADLHDVRTRLRREIASLDAEAQSLSSRLDCATFAHAVSTFQKSQEKSLVKLEQIQENSRQLAQEIRVARAKLADELKGVATVQSEKSEAILHIRDQLWGVAGREIEVTKERNEVRRQLYESLAELAKLRNEELSCESEDARKSAGLLVVYPTMDQAMLDALAKVGELKEEFATAIDGLDSSKASQREGSAAKKLARAQAALKALQKWLVDAKKKSERSATIAKGKLAKKRKRSTGQIRAHPYFTPFAESMGSVGVFLADVRRVLDLIEGILNESI